MKIFPWGWGHWLIFSSSFVQVPAFARVGGGGGTLTGALPSGNDKSCYKGHITANKHNQFVQL